MYGVKTVMPPLQAPKPKEEWAAVCLGASPVADDGPLARCIQNILREAAKMEKKDTTKKYLK